MGVSDMLLSMYEKLKKFACIFAKFTYIQIDHRHEN